MFCGPPEVERKILQCSGKLQNDAIEVTDVLRWSISETCVDARKSVPLWAIQGLRFQHRHVAWSRCSFSQGQGAVSKTAKTLLEPEAQSLEDRYGLGGLRPEEQALLHDVNAESLSDRKTQVDAIRAKCRDFEVVSFDNAALREEQERELSPEVEQERQVERPAALPPCEHNVHRDVEHFVRKGVLDRKSDAFRPAFELFGNTSAADYFDVEKWPGQLLVTIDFAQTVHAPANQHLDSFLRPVHWIASRANGDMIDCVVLSPYEAHVLLPSIRQRKTVTLHVYSPRVNMSVRSIEDLSFCAIPAALRLPSHPRLTMQLNLFAGQLYFKSYGEYVSVCRFLGLGFRPPCEQIEVAADGFVNPTDRPAFDANMEAECQFTISPVGFLRMVMALRRKRQNIEKSHVGRVLNGDLLGEDQF